jgi:hypothetical protein
VIVLKTKIATFVAILAIATIFISPLLVSAQTFQYVLGTDYYSPAEVSMPVKGAVYPDPNFHTSIVRVTDKSDGYSDDGIQNEYATRDPENCNGSFVILRTNDGELYLYDTSTFQMRNHFTDVSLGEEAEPKWDNNDPKIFYYVYGMQLRTYNIDTDTSTTIHDFKNLYPSGAYITAKVKGDASLDRRYWAFMVEDSDYNRLAVIVYDKATDKILGQKSSFPDSLNYVSIDMSGNHCVIGYDSIATQVFSRDLKTSIDLPAGANGHQDLAITADGRDVMVYQNNENDWIAMADLNTGAETKLVKIPFDVTPDVGLHFSGNCANTPGWALISTYGCKNPPPNSTHSWMDTQLFMVQLQANGTVWRIAHTQCYTALNFNSEKNYFAECFATINTQGSRIYFGSNWVNFTMDYSDAYMISLPRDWFAELSSSAKMITPVPANSPTPTPAETLPIITLGFPLTMIAAVFLIATILLVVIFLVRRKAGKTSGKPRVPRHQIN